MSLNQALRNGVGYIFMQTPLTVRGSDITRSVLIDVIVSEDLCKASEKAQTEKRAPKIPP